MTTPENPPRWAADPFGRHEYRYWDGVRWTEHVSDDGRVSVDAPIAAPVPPATSALAAPAANTGASYVARTPSVSPHDPTAVLGRRYGAFVIDAVICIVIFTTFFLVTATRYTIPEALRLPGCHLVTGDRNQVQCNGRVVATVNDTVYEANGSFVLLSVLFTLLYFAVAEGVWKGSLGKQVVGLRVVDAHGGRIGLPRAVARWALFAVDGPLSLFLCGIITSAVSSGHRRLGDMGAGSYVIGRADAGHPVTVPPR